MSVDRLADGYEPKFDLDYAWGEQGELFLQDIIKSIGTQRIEVKTDAMSVKTGNVYVELTCRGRPSGVQTSEAEFWAFVLPGDIIVVCRTEAVKVAALRAVSQGRKGRCTRGSHPTEGALLPVRWLYEFIKSCAQTINPGAAS